MSALADLIDARREAVAQAFGERARAERALGDQNAPERLEQLAGYLREVAAGLRAPNPAEPGVVARSADATPGGPCWHGGLDLGAIVRGYGLLQHLIILDLAREAGAPLPADEAQRLGDLFNAAMGRAVAEQARGLAEREGRFRAQARAAREEAEAAWRRLDELLRQAPVGVAIHEGPGHTYTFANDMYRSLVGGRDVAGKAFLDALPELRGQGFDLLFDRVKATGETSRRQSSPSPTRGKASPKTFCPTPSIAFARPRGRRRARTAGSASAWRSSSTSSSCTGARSSQRVRASGEGPPSGGGCPWPP